LMYFLAAIFNTTLPEETGKYLVVPTGHSVIDEETLEQFLKLRSKTDSSIFDRLIDWFTRTENSAQMVESLEKLQAEDLRRLNSLVGITALRNVLSIWKSNKDNDDEEFWQQTLANNAFVFSQVFSFPVVILAGKAYVGGKSILNTGGNVVDFLCTNNLTLNTALVEIKTPKTKLLSAAYRGDLYNVSSQLSGATLQIVNYRNSLLTSYNELSRQSDELFQVFDPKCIVIIGCIGKELLDRQKQKSFELFRASLRDVQVITYDELFSKVEILLNLLEGDGLI
jgi:hypothetical protein